MIDENRGGSAGRRGALGVAAAAAAAAAAARAVANRQRRRTGSGVGRVTQRGKNCYSATRGGFPTKLLSAAPKANLTIAEMGFINYSPFGMCGENRKWTDDVEWADWAVCVSL